MGRVGFFIKKTLKWVLGLIVLGLVVKSVLLYTLIQITTKIF